MGGVALGALPQPWQQAVLARLAAADAVCVRDSTTLGHLHSAGIAATLMPDPAVMVDALFGASIRARARQAPVADELEAFPSGYIAVQLAADFGDDATLDIVAAQLDAAVADTGLGVVLFRAGAAPWHDELGMLARIAARMAASAVRLFGSLDVWDICALLAHCRAHAGSSLHGHIVARQARRLRDHLGSAGKRGCAAGHPARRRHPLRVARRCEAPARAERAMGSNLPEVLRAAAVPLLS